MAGPLKLRTNDVAPQGTGVSVHVGAPTQAHAPDMFDRSFTHSLNVLDQGADQLSAAAQRSNEQDAAAWAGKTLSQARLDWTKTFLDRKEKAEAGGDGSFEDFTPQLLDDFDKYANETIDKAPSKHSRAYLSERLSALRGELGVNALGFEAQARIDAREDNIMSSIRNSGQVLSMDPSQFGVVLAERRAEISGSPLPPLRKSRLLELGTITLARNAVSSQIQKSPTAFLQSVGFVDGPDVQGKLRRTSGDFKEATGNQPFDLMPFDDRMKAIDSAIKAKNGIDSDADKAAVAMKKTLADNAMKDGWDLHFKGKLTEGYINQIKPLVSESDYKSLWTALRNGDGVQRTDPGVLRNIYQLVDSGQTAEARRQTYQAHRNGLMKNDGSDGLTGMLAHIDTLDKHDGPKTPYERGRQYITLSMDPGPGVPDPVGRGRLAEAVRDFDNWMLSGKREDKDIDGRAREIVGEYKLVDFRDTVLMLPQPRGGKITRQFGDIGKMESEIANSARNIQNDPKMKDAERQQELAKLKRWKDAMEAARGYITK